MQHRSYDYGRSFVRITDLEFEPLHGAKALPQALHGIFGHLVLLHEKVLNAGLARRRHDPGKIQYAQTNLSESIGRQVLFVVSLQAGSFVLKKALNSSPDALDPERI